jgi:integrase
MARGERVTTPNAKFAALAEDWYDSKRLLRPWTLKDYRAALDNVLLPRFGNLKLASITPDRIAALIRELEHKGLSGNWIANILKPLRGTIKLAMRRGVLAQNPLDLLTSDERPKRTQREHYIWSPQDVDALLSASTALAERPHSTLRLHAHESPTLTGLRIGELLGLRWQDVNLKEAVIHVRRQWTRTGELAHPKTPVDDAFMAASRVARVRESRLRREFERTFITPTGTRATVLASQDSTGGLPNAAVDELQRRHLIRAEWRAGARWYKQLSLPHPGLRWSDVDLRRGRAPRRLAARRREHKPS